MFRYLVYLLSFIFDKTLAVSVARLVVIIVIVLIIFVIFRISNFIFKHIARTNKINDISSDHKDIDNCIKVKKLTNLFDDAPYKIEPKDVDYIED